MLPKSQKGTKLSVTINTRQHRSKTSYIDYKKSVSLIHTKHPSTVSIPWGGHCGGTSVTTTTWTNGPSPGQTVRKGDVPISKKGESYDSRNPSSVTGVGVH